MFGASVIGSQLLAGFEDERSVGMWRWHAWTTGCVWSWALELGAIRGLLMRWWLGGWATGVAGWVVSVAGWVDGTGWVDLG